MNFVEVIRLGLGISKKVNNKADVSGMSFTELIKILKTSDKYKDSFCKKVVATIENSGRCSDKQRSVLNKSYEAWFGSQNNKKETNESAVQTHTAQPQTANTSVEHRVENTRTDSNINWSSDIRMFNLDIRDGNKLYIKGLKPEFNRADINIKIPSKVRGKNGDIFEVVGVLNEAFARTKIKRVHLGSISDLGAEAFCNCTNLVEADFRQTNVNFIPRLCFNECTMLKDLYLNNSIFRIHEKAFYGCARLVSVTLNNEVESLGAKAFAVCSNLRVVKGLIDNLYESAFNGCESLEEIDLSKVSSIGARAFKDTGFDKIVIPSNVRVIADYAFASCDKLKEVDIEDGCTTIGVGAFYSDDKSHMKRIRVPKSVVEIEAGAFRNCDRVEVWTGSIAESYCIGYDLPYVPLDDLNDENGTKIRKLAGALGINVVDQIAKLVDAEISDELREKREKEYKIDTEKLRNIDMNDIIYGYIGVEPIDDSVEVKEPGIMFKAYLNMIQKVSNFYSVPFSKGVIRLINSLSPNGEILYSDGYNRIVKVTHTEIDTFDKGGFIVVLMGNMLVYSAKLNYATDVIFNKPSIKGLDKDFDYRPLSVNKYVRVGDKLGVVATISGERCIIKDESGPIAHTDNIGRKYTDMLHSEAIEMNYTRKDSCWYIPTEHLCIIMHDNREWIGSGDSKRLKDKNGDYSNVIEMFSEDEMASKLTETRFAKYPLDSDKFYNSIASMGEDEARARNESLALVGEESEGQLYEVSKNFNNDLMRARRALGDIDKDNLVQYMSINTLIGLMKSHMMVSKDRKWLDNSTLKSLNKIAEYKLDNDYMIEEYKSNIVIKFSNSYMSGTKGAHVFVVKRNGSLVSIKVSRYELNDICDKLHKMTYIPDTIHYRPKLMQNPREFDIVDSDLFYDFAPITFYKDFWSSLRFGARNSFNASAWISMYKPTGAYYLIVKSSAFSARHEGETIRFGAVPVVPIGFLNRALTVAATTNNNVTDSLLFRELVCLEDYIVSEIRGRGYTFRDGKIHNPLNYIRVRELLVNGVRDISQYKGLIDSHVVYMMGITSRTSVLKKDNSGTEYTFARNVERKRTSSKKASPSISTKSNLEILDEDDSDDEIILNTEDEESDGEVEIIDDEEDYDSEIIIDDEDDDIDDDEIILDEDDIDEDDIDIDEDDIDEIPDNEESDNEDDDDDGISIY